MQTRTRFLAALLCAAVLLPGAPDLRAQESDAPADAPAELATEAEEPVPSETGARTSKRPSNYDDPGVAGGRDVVPHRPIHLVWRELVEARNQLYAVVDGRDLRAVILTPEEKSLIVAFSKRAFDLCDEFDALTFERLDGKGRYWGVRISLRFLQTELAEIRSIGAGPIHRHLPRVLTKLTIRLRGVYQANKEHPELLGTLGLPGLRHEDETVPLPSFKGDEFAPVEEPERTPSS